MRDSRSPTIIGSSPLASRRAFVQPPRLLKRVTIHTDGGCQGNPGPGAWAAVLQYGRQELEIGGGVPATTNNRMELQAAIESLAVLNQSCEIEFFTDSQYLRQGITGWIHGWKRNGWQTAEKKPVKNSDLWRRLDELVAKHAVTWRWLKGHAGHPLNERCDVRANLEMAKVRQKFSREELRRALVDFQSSET